MNRGSINSLVLYLYPTGSQVKFYSEANTPRSASNNIYKVEFHEELPEIITFRDKRRPLLIVD